MEQLFRDGNRDALVGELRSRVSQAEAEDLIQRSIERALSGRCRAEHVGGVHAWVRQDAQFALSHLLDRRRVAREKLVRERNALPRPDEIPGPEAEMLREGNAELAAKLVEEAGLSPLDQNIVRLYWGERLPRKLVAGELGIAEGTLKKRLARAGSAFEGLLVKRCGGGCGGDGQHDVVAYAFQHRRMPEGTLARAVEHMKDCELCARLFSRLEQVRLAVAAMTPVPIAAGPGAVGSSHGGLTERLGEGIAWAREQITTLSMRVHEIAMSPPPVKPGATLASIGVCAVAAGGSYCLEGAVEPLRALSPPAHERLQTKKPDKPRRDIDAVPAGTVQAGPPPAIEPAPTPGPPATPAPAPEPEPAPASPPEPAPQPRSAPSQEFDFEQSAPAPAPSPPASSSPAPSQPKPQPDSAPPSGGGGGGGGGGGAGAGAGSGEFL